ncbi:MAG: hypothetical protein KF878_13120 [Planctomycetes bacterium]|nr:hypothetical protein [Planctomycetota bacterium]
MDRRRALVDHLRSEVDLEGASARALEAHVDQALGWCEDEGWAASFAAGCPVEGARPRDYLQRVLPLPGGGEVVCGIRFLGGDVRQPFVEVVAWDRPLAPRWPALALALRAAFSRFAPAHHLCVPAGARPRRPAPSPTCTWWRAPCAPSATARGLRAARGSSA